MTDREPPKGVEYTFTPTPDQQEIIERIEVYVRIQTDHLIRDIAHMVGQENTLDGLEASKTAEVILNNIVFDAQRDGTQEALQQRIGDIRSLHQDF